MRGVDEPSAAARALYIEAADEHRARASLASRGLVVASCEGIDRAPEGESVQRVRGGIEREAMPAGLRRLIFIAIGVGLGVVVIAGTVFVLRAREHLTRSDVRPKVLDAR